MGTTNSKTATTTSEPIKVTEQKVALAAAAPN